MKRLCMQAAFTGYISELRAGVSTVPMMRGGRDGETHSCIIMTDGSLNEGVTLTNGVLCCGGVSLWLSLTAPPHLPLSLMTSCDEGRWPVTAASCLLMCAYVGSRWWQGGEFVNGFSVCSAALSHLRSCAGCGSGTIGANECAWQNCWGVQPKYRWHSLLRTLPRWPACWTRRKRSKKKSASCPDMRF